MKISVEVSEEDLEFLSKTLKVDGEKFLRDFIPSFISALKEFTLATKTIPMTPDIAQKMGMHVTQDLLEKTRKTRNGGMKHIP